jgi:hypothetical protein
MFPNKDKMVIIALFSLAYLLLRIMPSSTQRLLYQIHPRSTAEIKLRSAYPLV